MPTNENPLEIILRRFRLLIKFIGAGIRVNALKPFWHDRYVVRTLFLSAALNLATWAYLHENKFGEGFPLILHYNLFLGVDVVGEFRQLYILPAVGLLFLVLNAALGQFFFKIERLASYLLTLNTLIVEIILLLASYLLIRVNQ